MTTTAVPRDPLTLRFTGADHYALAAALASAFPDPDSLDQMLVARLDQPLNAISAPYPITDATHKVVRLFKARGHLLRLVDAARASQPDNPELRSFAEGFGLAAPTPASQELEKFVTATSVPFPVSVWRTHLTRRERCVCRVEVTIDGASSFGTGFLVAPDLVLTNHHVVARAIDRKGTAADGISHAIVCRFDYKEELTSALVVNPGVEERLDEDWLVDSCPPGTADLSSHDSILPAPGELDFALLRLERAAGSLPIPLGPDVDARSAVRGWIELPDREWSFDEHQSLFIIQHTQAGPMQLALDADAGLALNGNATRVRYRTGTQPGSSGSPCFNRFWNVVALHHGADRLYPELDVRGWNEGIPIRRIVERLERLGLTAALTLRNPAGWKPWQIAV